MPIAIGSTSITGAALSAQSNKIDIGGKSTSDITIGASTVSIGSDASVINLSGSVTINGKALDGRRLSEDDWSETRGKQFGYLNAVRMVVAVARTEPWTTFTLRWDNGFSSEPKSYQVDKQRMLVVDSAVGDDGKVDTRHLQVSLHIASVVLSVKSDDLLDTVRPSKIRYVLAA
ncbi:unnamed protein product [Phytophthora lilii]|uniref:Unnamed protein product n=1 Tax=Phytophthora lilii TaxID=2077276 RepID=A0A9W6WPI2_9STRA|nr:unnamed protein product [Phytophthora lilii]